MTLPKLLLLTNSNVGLYRFRKETLIELSEHHHIIISSPNDGFFDELSGLPITYVPTTFNRRGINLFAELSLLIKYYRLIKKYKPSAILTYTIKPNIYGNLVARLYKIPVITTITGLGDTFIKKGLTKQLIIVLYKLSFEKTRTLIFENSEDSSIFRELGILRKQQVLQTPGAGVNLEEHIPLPYPISDKTVFLYVGRYMRTKGIAELLEACKKLTLSHPNQFEMILMGHSEQELSQEIAQAVQANIVTDVGFQTDIKPYIQQAHAIVLPSYKEGMSNALLEAAAMGRPLIATDVSGCREAVDVGINGYLCEAMNASSLYSALVQFIEHSPAEKQAMGVASRHKVEGSFDRDIVTEKILNTLQTI